MKKALLKDSLKQIAKTNKRFISILLMAFMGVGFFAGVRSASPDMKATIDTYYDNKNMYDISLVSTLGLTDEDIKVISELDGIDKAIGIYSEDVFVKFEDEETVVKYITYENEINNLEIIEGNLPQNENECTVEYNMNIGKNVNVGDYIEITENLQDDETANLKNNKLKVVGIVKSPIYISRDRGTTNLGNGKLNYYMYGNKNNIDSEVYTEIDITVKGAKELNTKSDEYNELIENVKENLESIKSEREKIRYDELILEANTKLDDAQNEFNKEKSEAEEKIRDAEKEIEKAKKEIGTNEKKLKDAERELESGKNTANTEFSNAETQISSAETQLATAQLEINDGRAYYEAKKNEAQTGINQLNTGIQTLNSTISDLEENQELAESVLNSIEKINSTLISFNNMLIQNEEALKNATTEKEKLELTEMIKYTKTRIIILWNYYRKIK